MYIGGLGEGRGQGFFFGFLFPWQPPKGSHIYIYIYIHTYIHTHYVCFSSFLFSGNLHDSLDILWQPLATPEEVRQSVWISSNTITGIWTYMIEHDVAETLHSQKRGKTGPDSVLFCNITYIRFINHGGTGEPAGSATLTAQSGWTNGNCWVPSITRTGPMAVHVCSLGWSLAVPWSLKVVDLMGFN